MNDQLKAYSDPYSPALSVSTSISIYLGRFSMWPPSPGTGEVFRFAFVPSAGKSVLDSFCLCKTCSCMGKSKGTAGPFLTEILPSCPFLACCCVPVDGWDDGIDALAEFGKAFESVTFMTKSETFGFDWGSSIEHACGSRREKPFLQLVASSSPRQWLSTSIYSRALVRSSMSSPRGICFEKYGECCRRASLRSAKAEWLNPTHN